jgi:hypothetical protein
MQGFQGTDTERGGRGRETRNTDVRLGTVHVGKEQIRETGDRGRGTMNRDVRQGTKDRRQITKT